MEKINLDIRNLTVKVRNSETGDNALPNALEYYFKNKYGTSVFSSSICPSCGKKMYRKKSFPYYLDKDIMVGGHVEFVAAPALKYIVPMCKECNDKKSNLPPFEVNLDCLLLIK